MSARQPNLTLAIEGGGTRTVALFADAAGRILQRVEAGPLNLKRADDADVLALFRQLRRLQPPRSGTRERSATDVAAISLCLAGARTDADRARARALAARVWPRAACTVRGDRESGLAAAFGVHGAGILVIAGTGSSIIGRDATGRIIRAGGYGPLLSDAGSGYDIARAALRAVLHEWDLTGRWPALGSRFLRALVLNDIEQLVDWSVAAPKGDVAALAPEVFAAWHRRDPLATRIIVAAADDLAANAILVARKLGWGRNKVVNFCLKGGLVEKQPRFFAAVATRIRRAFPRAVIALPKHEGAFGALLLAGIAASAQDAPRSTLHAPREIAAALTEQRNPRTLDLDRRSVSQLVDTMLAEDSRILPAIRRQRRAIVRAIELITRSLRRGGRLFYIGAGTSGRLGVLDASECPPTFSVEPKMVQGIIAGGERALYSSVEAAEDDPSAGAEALRCRGAQRGDVVVGIAASGRTPFVLGALAWAKQLGIETIFLNFNPMFRWPHGAATAPTVTVSVATGPEVVTGSTRLKAGTATKLILNMFTTIAMVRLGKVVGNLMVDVDPTCVKLRDRATRIVSALTGADYAEAGVLLEKSGWVVNDAIKSRGRQSRPKR
ncbi:MAG: N-acetylmuramic acid 6-phosphate etherase [Verrucomicrobia bacterium]|nr:N-acetylmuramic acid 6-phosphate etherase [Verrucomicrobiota bacterium]